MSFLSLLMFFSLMQTPAMVAEPQVNPPAKSVVWATIGYKNTKGREGPGLNYPIVWVYNPRGLPVIVLRRANEWSRVQDMEGDIVWMSNTVLENRATALVISSEPTPLFADNKKRNKVIARIAKNVVVGLKRCEADQCMIRVKGKTGWVQKAVLWGPVQN